MQLEAMHNSKNAPNLELVLAVEEAKEFGSGGGKREM